MKEPDGWFLLHCKHTHTAIVFRGDIHEPMPNADGPWVVVFQKLPTGENAVECRGKTMQEAWIGAYEKTGHVYPTSLCTCDDKPLWGIGSE